MLELVKPLLIHKDQYIEMISECQQYGKYYGLGIIEYDCSNPITELDYDAFLKTISDYSNGKIYYYDEDYFAKSKIYFLLDRFNLIDMGEIMYPINIYDSTCYISCGIRPSKRNQKYEMEALKCILKKIDRTKFDEAIIFQDDLDSINSYVIKKLDFQHIDSDISEISKKEIKYYMKKIKR